MKPKQVDHKFKIGVRVPEEDVNLAYFDVPPLNPQNNIIIGDFSSSITHRLRDVDKNSVINLDTPISRQIRVFPPTVIDGTFEPWYLRVRNGFFRMLYHVTGKEKETGIFVDNNNYLAKPDRDVILLYNVYDLFVNQYFVYGNGSLEKEVNNMWLKPVVGEIPEIVSHDSLRLAFIPVYFWNDSVIQNNRGNLKIIINGNELDSSKIEHIDSFTGIILLKTRLSFNDQITVDYWYETDTFDYHFFTTDFAGNNKVDMDMNPLNGHAGSASFSKTAYVYIKPFAMIAATHSEFAIFNGDVESSLFPEYNQIPHVIISLPSTIHHPGLDSYITTPVGFKQVYTTYKPEIFREPRILVDPSNLYGGFYLDGRPAAVFGEGIIGGVEEINPFYDPTAVLLASVTTNVDVDPQNIKLVDTRSRGGGLKENIDLEEVRKIQPEIEHFWDTTVSFWDGRAFMENGVFVLEIPKILLKENGGDYTEAQIQEIIQERAALGILPIVRFV